VDAAGRVATPFTTRGMLRGWIGAEGAPRVSVFADD
jgi:beta-aspartyl-peptidase (threonine type)